MDQSLRTVATQLLNVTNSEEVLKVDDKSAAVKHGDLASNVVATGKIEKVKKVVNVKENSKPDDKSSLVKEMNKEISDLESMGVSFGRPVNSKFGYFEPGHPGQAMAMTEEELEKEMASTRLMTAYKNQQTTSGGISTWILLNPPSTTPKTLSGQEKTKPENDVKFQVKPTASVEKRVTKNEEKVKTTTEKVAQSNDKQSTNNWKKTTTAKPEKGSQNSNKREKPPATSGTTTLKSVDTVSKNVNSTPKSVNTIPPTVQELKESPTTPKSIATTKKTVFPNQTSIKPKVTQPTTTRPLTTKIVKPNFNRPKQSVKTTTEKPEAEIQAATLKVEKVTFRPVPMISTPKNDLKTDRPIFITKIKASVLTDVHNPTTPIVTMTTTQKTTSSNFSGSDLVEVPIKTRPQPSKVNNVLKVQLKKPVDEGTTIEIKPIKVNAPILKIEKIEEDTKKVPKIEKPITNNDEVSNSPQIDLKFDFNPELTKIDVESSTVEALLSTTTKKPRRSSNKRKKNKHRRRKPSRTSTTAVETSTSSESMLDAINELSSDLLGTDTSIQESKVAPESKVTNPTKNNKNKKQIQKPIGTQIYNFLSREIMPSVGVMSLVGLGLGLASYFLYPFGGGIARRNYEVEPNYKYNLDEYGGNQGVSEEEVFSKVLQGMTNHDAKFGGIKDYENNYYHYQHSDSKATSKKGSNKNPTPSTPVFSPLENTYDLKYRNTEFKYPDLPTTPNYYERQKQAGYTVGSVTNVDNRQFVVGNVPKGYSYDESKPVDKAGSAYVVGESGQSEFEQKIAQTTYDFPKNPVNIAQPFGLAEAQALKVADDYEEVEITPTAVAVEHGPRALKVKRSLPIKSRSKRDSVIQIISPHGQVMEEGKEENLSNEILDIIESMIPGSEDHGKTKDPKGTHKLDLEKRKHEEKMKAHQKTTTYKPENQTKDKVTTTTSKMNERAVEVTTIASTTKITKGDTTPESSSSTTEKPDTEKYPEDYDSSTEASLKDLEETTVLEDDSWFDPPTTPKAETSSDQGFDVFGFVRRIADIKFRLGVAVLRHASEGLARYLGHVQKRINGEE